jgi:predicted ATP-dependent serine protease
LSDGPSGIGGTFRAIEPSRDGIAAGNWGATGLVGRSSECRLIERLLDDAHRGRSRVLVVCGEPGIGKTALLDHAVSAATAKGMRVVRASGVESEMELAFAGLHLLCGPMFDHLAQLPEPQRVAMSIAFGLTTGPRPETLLIALALLSLLGEVAEQTPLLCVVDDAHWRS